MGGVSETPQSPVEIVLICSYNSSPGFLNFDTKKVFLLAVKHPFN